MVGCCLNKNAHFFFNIKFNLDKFWLPFWQLCFAEWGVGLNASRNFFILNLVYRNRCCYLTDTQLSCHLKSPRTAFSTTLILFWCRFYFFIYFRMSFLLQFKTPVLLFTFYFRYSQHPSDVSKRFFFKLPALTLNCSSISGWVYHWSWVINWPEADNWRGDVCWVLARLQTAIEIGRA